MRNIINDRHSSYMEMCGAFSGIPWVKHPRKSGKNALSIINGR